ncbi:MAG: hypothetical protein EOP24_27115 [Hyphomicrobiales bacterium]|nr:MAG: hypothetical protein EOP24_27115 [Hyphomicrobiales bacterium]
MTIKAIRQLLVRVACSVGHALVDVWHWSNWRRASQARARASHYKHRPHKFGRCKRIELSALHSGTRNSVARGFWCW